MITSYITISLRQLSILNFNAVIQEKHRKNVVPKMIEVLLHLQFYASLLFVWEKIEFTYARMQGQRS